MYIIELYTIINMCEVFTDDKDAYMAAEIKERYNSRGAFEDDRHQQKHAQ